MTVQYVAAQPTTDDCGISQCNPSELVQTITTCLTSSINAVCDRQQQFVTGILQQNSMQNQQMFQQQCAFNQQIIQQMSTIFMNNNQRYTSPSAITQHGHQLRSLMQSAQSMIANSAPTDAVVVDSNNASNITNVTGGLVTNEQYEIMLRQAQTDTAELINHQLGIHPISNTVGDNALHPPPQTLANRLITSPIENDALLGERVTRRSWNVRVFMILPWTTSYARMHHNDNVPGFSLTVSGGNIVVQSDSFNQLQNYMKVMNIPGSINSEQALKRYILSQIPQWFYYYLIHGCQFEFIERNMVVGSSNVPRRGDKLMTANWNRTQWKDYYLFTYSIRDTGSHAVDGHVRRSLILRMTSPLPQGTYLREAQFNSIQMSQLPVDNIQPNTISVRNGSMPICLPDGIHPLSVSNSRLNSADKSTLITEVNKNHRPYLIGVCNEYGVHVNDTNRNIRGMINTIREEILTDHAYNLAENYTHRHVINISNLSATNITNLHVNNNINLMVNNITNLTRSATQELSIQQMIDEELQEIMIDDTGSVLDLSTEDVPVDFIMNPDMRECLLQYNMTIGVATQMLQEVNFLTNLSLHDMESNYLPHQIVYNATFIDLDQRYFHSLINSLSHTGIRNLLRIQMNAQGLTTRFSYIQWPFIKTCIYIYQNDWVNAQNIANQWSYRFPWWMRMATYVTQSVIPAVFQRYEESGQIYRWLIADYTLPQFQNAIFNAILISRVNIGSFITHRFVWDATLRSLFNLNANVNDMIDYNGIIGCSSQTPSDMDYIRSLIGANTQSIFNFTFTTGNNSAIMWRDWCRHIESIININTSSQFILEFMRSSMGQIRIRDSIAVDVGGLTRVFSTNNLGTALSQVLVHAGRDMFGLPARLVPFNETLALNIVITMGCFMMKMKHGFGQRFHPVVLAVMVGDHDVNSLNSMDADTARTHLRTWLGHLLGNDELLFTRGTNQFPPFTITLHPVLEAFLEQTNWNESNQQQLNLFPGYNISGSYEDLIIEYIWEHVVQAMSPFLRILQRYFTPLLSWIANLNEPRVPQQEILRFLQTGIPVTTQDVINAIRFATNSDDVDENIVRVGPWIQNFLEDRGSDVLVYNDGLEPHAETVAERLCNWVTGQRFFHSGLELSLDTIHSTDPQYTANTVYAQTCTNTLQVISVISHAITREQFMEGMNQILLSPDRTATAAFMGAP
eukprot:176471_1